MNRIVLFEAVAFTEQRDQAVASGYDGAGANRRPPGATVSTGAGPIVGPRVTSPSSGARGTRRFYWRQDA